MKHSDCIGLLEKYGQKTLLRHYRSLPAKKQSLLLQHMQGLDMDLVFRLQERFSSRPEKSRGYARIEPAHVIPIPRTETQKDVCNRAKARGEEYLREGKVAVLIVAGGQGSRLGFDGPKGTYPISPLKNKTLFQLFAEQVRARSERYNTRIPLLIMTSDENHAETIKFFDINNHFGLSRRSVLFFRQEMLPAITPDGKLLLRNETQLFVNPNGHGGSLKALYDSGMFDRIMEMGCSELFYCQVDNPLVRIADPVFLGYHGIAEAEVSTKVVRRRNIEEKVGVYLSAQGKDTIIEYSDLDPEYMSALDDRGNILYWAGNTAIHLFSLRFIERINRHGFALPYHCASKIADTINEEGKSCSLDVWKFETFVFDAIPLADRTCAMEVLREEEFSPVKNGKGTDSSETARSAMISLHSNWVEKQGTRIRPGTAIEVSPLFALDEEDFCGKSVALPDTIEGDTYFGT